MTIYQLIVGSIALGIMGSAPVAYSADSYIQINGNLTSNTCAVSTDSQNKTVDMGTVATKQFLAASHALAPVRFALVLENCGAAVSSVSTTFTGSADQDDATLLALNSESTATNVGIAILDKERNRIPLGSASEQYPLTASASSVQMVFYGQYVATQNSVTAGTANGDVTFTLSYQ
ncbi:fimbrial protein [Affinibrenneria salicis]|uniref:Fimbrial protein n=1 Tax=Affinibrenneria salicis TaxID=2590031 RepID=A0A5J5FRW3_9GAMM|nr:fimbrial protein [Affinibrenneria salicis]KAA8995382.1 fimbrial protein [Affinibrenneria salicis]